MGPCSPGDVWTPACPWEALKSFWVLLCLHTCLLLFSLLKSPDLTPQILWLLLFQFSPNPTGGGVSEGLCGAWFLAGVKPRKNMIWLIWYESDLKLRCCYMLGRHGSFERYLFIVLFWSCFLKDTGYCGLQVLLFPYLRLPAGMAINWDCHLATSTTGATISSRIGCWTAVWWWMVTAH